jgi:phosphonate transport system substrate-binding protein
VVFFELVTGQRLFHRSTELMTLKAITEEPIPRASELNPDLPEAVSAIIARCLERDPERRFSTASELGAAVRELSAEAAPGSPQAALARFIQGEFKALLEKRAAAIKKVSEYSHSGSAVPVMDGLGSDTGPSPSLRGATAGIPAGAAEKRRGIRARSLLLLSLAILALAVAAGLAYRFLGGPARPPGPALLFGMAPSFPAEVVQKEMVPLLSVLEQRIGRRLELSVTDDYHSLRAALVTGELAFAHLPPLQYVLARHVDRDLKLLVSHLYEGTRSYQALIIARAGSNIRSLSDLEGKRFCYVDPESTSGYLLPRYHLREQGYNPDHFFAATRFSGNHIAVMRDILQARCDAGAVYSGALNVAASHGVASSQLWHVAVTGQLPHEVICASSQLDARLAGAMKAALLGMDMRRDLGRELVGETLRLSGFSVAKRREFDFVQEAALSEGLIR